MRAIDDCLYKQNAPLFNPKGSSTFKPYQCDNCPKDIHGGSCKEEEGCTYNITSLDNSYTTSILAKDVITLTTDGGEPFRIENYDFGCSSGVFSPDEAGIIGLDFSPGSLMKQTLSSIGGQFSHCIPPYFPTFQKPGFIAFGENIPADPGTVTTEFEFTEGGGYIVTLNGFTVGAQFVEFTSSSEGGIDDFNTLLDTGTSLNILPEEFYDKFDQVYCTF